MTTEPSHTEIQVTDHYEADGLVESILAALIELDKSPSTVTVEDLAPVDEFHIGGRRATTELCEHLGATAESEILDIGCGIGGSARFAASKTGCHVTGIDLTTRYIDAARTLSEWTGQQDCLRFEVASALAMPFEAESFDGAIQLHVGMNIADKAALYAEVFRVLRPGGRLVIYDIMRTAEGEVSFPVPWASGPATSLIDDAATYRAALDTAGFEGVQERDRRELALDFFAALRAGSGRPGGPPPLGLHLVMGPEAPRKIANMVRAVTDGVLAPVEIVCSKPDSAS